MVKVRVQKPGQIIVNFPNNVKVVTTKEQLSSISDYFKSMFERNFEESLKDEINIKSWNDDLKAQDFETIKQILLCQEVDLEIKDIYRVYVIMEYLGMLNLWDSWKDTIFERIKTNDCHTPEETVSLWNLYTQNAIPLNYILCNNQEKWLEDMKEVMNMYMLIKFHYLANINRFINIFRVNEQINKNSFSRSELLDLERVIESEDNPKLISPYHNMKYIEDTVAWKAKDVFLKRLNDVLKNPEQIPWDKGVLLAGGALIGCIQQEKGVEKGSDIDLWIYGSKYRETKEALSAIIKYIQNNYTNPVFVINKSVITIIAHDMPHNIQIVYTTYEFPEDVVSRFDLDYLHCYYNGTDVYSSPECLTAWITGITSVGYMANIQQNRFTKALYKGFSINTIPEGIDSEKALEDIREYKNLKYYIPHKDADWENTALIAESIFRGKSCKGEEILNNFTYQPIGLNFENYEVEIKIQENKDISEHDFSIYDISNLNSMFTRLNFNQGLLLHTPTIPFYIQNVKSQSVVTGNYKSKDYQIYALLNTREHGEFIEKMQEMTHNIRESTKKYMLDNYGKVCKVGINNINFLKPVYVGRGAHSKTDFYLNIRFMNLSCLFNKYDNKITEKSAYNVKRKGSFDIYISGILKNVNDSFFIDKTLFRGRVQPFMHSTSSYTFQNNEDI